MQIQMIVPTLVAGPLLAACLLTSPARAQDPVDRPLPWTLGVGIGTLVNGTSVLAPNTASVRFVLSDAIQVEPLVNVTVSGQSNAGGSDNATTLRAGGLLRYVYASSGAMDLQLLGGAVVGFLAAGGASTLELSASYGLSVVWYGSEHWSISGDATNPVLTFNRASPDEGDSATAYTLGAVWNPTVTAMIHFYM